MCHTVYVIYEVAGLVEKHPIESLRLELRRGSLVLAVLGTLTEEHYGYTLCRQLNEHGIDIEESTLYPLLRRLEAQGLLTSEWREQNRRRKRFYRLSADGVAALATLTGEWSALNEALNTIL